LICIQLLNKPLSIVRRDGLDIAVQSSRPCLPDCGILGPSRRSVRWHHRVSVASVVCRAFAQQADLWGRNNLQEELQQHKPLSPQSCELRDKGAGGDVRFYCFDQYGYLPLLPAQAGTHRLWWQRLKIGFPRSRDAEPGASKNSPQGHVAWRCSRRRFSRGASTPCTESPPSRSAHHEDVVLDKFRDLQARHFARRSPISISLCCWSHLRPPRAFRYWTSRVPLLDLQQARFLREDQRRKRKVNC
jgi:hypothetical protein